MLVTPAGQVQLPEVVKVAAPLGSSGFAPTVFVSEPVISPKSGIVSSLCELSL
jgi:hypothetical protein